MFIASTFADTVGLFKQRVKGGAVIFIANPADPFKNKYWVRKDFKAFQNNGYKTIPVDLKQHDADGLSRMLKDYDIIHFCGGSAIYTLQLLREKKMDVVIVDAVKSGLIYTGTSAGSMIVAPDISLCAEDVDEKEAAMVGKIKNFKGLGLVPYYLMCHSQEKYYVPSTKKAINQLPKNKLPILMLNDGMAVWHENGSMQILNTKELS